MGESKQELPDGRYHCRATVHVQGGKAVVVLHDTFGLKPGAAVPLLRHAHDLRVQSLPGGLVVVLDGHAIV